MDAGMHDLRSAWRRLRQAPSLIAVVVITLALGVGINCAVFSLAWAAVFAPLPFPQANRLVWVSSTNVRQHRSDLAALSPDQLRAWKGDLGQIFSSYTAVSGGGVGDVYRIRGAAMEPVEQAATGNTFAFLGVRPALGRLIEPQDCEPGHQYVVVLSHAFWQQVYGGDPRVVGQTITEQTGTKPYTIIGVLPAGFRLNHPTDLWFPSAPNRFEHGFAIYSLIGRRRAGISVAAVQDRIGALEQRNPLNLGGNSRTPPLTFQATTLRTEMTGRWREPMLVLLAAAACLLLLACLNIANLLLARAREREAELALRLTLGCSPQRLVGQMLVESGMLAAVGGLAGWLSAVAAIELLAHGGSALLPAAVAGPLRHWNPHAVSGVVVVFAVALSALTLLLFGFVPALRVVRASLRAQVQSRGQRIGRTPQLLVAAEVALALVLVLSAGLLLHSFRRLAGTNPGFDPRGVISFEVDLPIPNHRLTIAQGNADQAYLQTLLERIRSLPGVAQAAATDSVPLADTDPRDFASVPNAFQRVFPGIVSPGYFATLGIPIRAGRDFSVNDRIGDAKKVIVNQAFVNRYFPGQNLLGRVLPLPRCEKGFLSNPQNGCTVVGIAGNVRGETLAIAPHPAAFLSMTQDRPMGYSFVLRTRTSTVGVLPELQRLLHTLPPPEGVQPFVFPPVTLDHTVQVSLASPRFRAWLAGLFAALALALAAVGIYGIESHAVSRRRHEIGVRAALGATRADVCTWVLATAVRWALLGIVLALPVALAAGHVLAHMLYRTEAWDPVSFVAAPLLLLAVALLAAWRPARRAMSVDPIEVLRSE